MIFGIITLFPKMFNAITNYGIVGKAISKKIVQIKIWNPRNFSDNKYRSVDSPPYGGGSGMLMKAKPLISSILEAKLYLGKNTKVLYLSPQGKKLKQNNILYLSKTKKLILVCGRYKGIDERIIDLLIDEEWSVGDYILSGGELPAMILIDSITRLIPGVLKNTHSLIEDSFVSGLLDCPHYTKPYVLENKTVPKVLLSGNHKKIKNWKLQQSLGRTWLRRPDLLKKIFLNKEKKNFY